MLLYFLRHGDASSHENEHPLTETGRRQADTVGLYMLHNGFLVNRIYTSPLLRARETGTLVRQHISSTLLEATEFLVNGTNLHQFFRFINGIDAESILFIGHEPFLSETISMLIAGHPHSGIEIKKCTLALVEIDSPIRAGSGILKTIVDVKTMQQSA
ncbi:MAG: histidine phosphatase family protein [Bacteroidota bacterium]